VPVDEASWDNTRSTVWVRCAGGKIYHLHCLPIAALLVKSHSQFSRLLRAPEILSSGGIAC